MPGSKTCSLMVQETQLPHVRVWRSRIRAREETSPSKVIPTSPMGWPVIMCWLINSEALTGTCVRDISVVLKEQKFQQLCGRIREGNHYLNPARGSKSAIWNSRKKKWHLLSGFPKRGSESTYILQGNRTKLTKARLWQNGTDFQLERVPYPFLVDSVKGDSKIIIQVQFSHFPQFLSIVTSLRH